MATNIALWDWQDFDRQELRRTSLGFDNIISLMGQEIDKGKESWGPKEVKAPMGGQIILGRE